MWVRRGGGGEAADWSQPLKKQEASASLTCLGPLAWQQMQSNMKYSRTRKQSHPGSATPNPVAHGHGGMSSHTKTRSHTLIFV